MTRALVIAGYFDWFSGYQETVVAAALALHADVEIIASDRVAPIFGDAHLAHLGVERRYRPGRTYENGVVMHRVPVRERRGMVWGSQARRLVEEGYYDLIVQVMPGQVLPVAATVARVRAKRVALYGDNSAMWTRLSTTQRRLKWAAFAASKGATYRLVNARADVVYGYTPDTLTRLAPFSSKPLQLLPLAFDERRFYADPQLRATVRAERGYGTGERVVVFAGKFDPVKRLDLILHAFAKARADNPTLRLLLVGSDGGAYRQELEALAGRLGITDTLRIEGFLDAVGLNAAFNAADVGVWPRQPAITIQQSMASGLPVVIPQTPWVSHLVDDTTGVYVERLDSQKALDVGLRAALALDLGEAARAARAETNRRLGGTAVARSILSDTGLA